MAQTKKGAAKTKRIYGQDCFKEWGKLGGNPILLKAKKRGK